MSAAPSNTLDRQTTRNSDEEWRDIPGFGGGYQASSHGRIRSFKRFPEGQVLKLTPANVRSGSALTFTPAGRVPGTRGGLSVARAVALAFLGEPPSSGAKVLHRNSDAMDNTPANLRWEV